MEVLGKLESTFISNNFLWF